MSAQQTSSHPAAQNVRFLFFREDGWTFGIETEPTAEDYDHARVGLHIIVRLSDLQVFDRAGEWSPLIRGTLMKEPGADAAPYHVPADFGGHPSKD